MKYETKPGKHGTVYRYEIDYRSPDPGSPTFTTRMWAYDFEHALERFQDQDDPDWIVERIARVATDPRALHADEGSTFGRRLSRAPDGEEPELHPEEVLPGALEGGRMSKSEALVIVHLSSLDSYTAMELDAGGDGSRAWRLATGLASAVRKHKGPVVVVDQEWSFGPSRHSAPRKDVLQAMTERSPSLGPIEVMHFDEDYQAWGPFLRRLRKMLKDLKVKSAVVGGIWYDYELQSGCATHVFLDLRKILPTRVDGDLVGCESDIDDGL